jgi:hypothetical protein
MTQRAEGVRWWGLYRAAMLELELSELPKRIETAQTAIRRSMEELSASNHDGGAAEELQRMADALENLRTLQRVAVKSSTKHGAAGDSAPRERASL